MKEHILKTEATCWDAIEAGEKTFEVRRNDRFFQAGDTVVLQRLKTGITGGKYLDTDMESGKVRELCFTIGWMLHGGQYGVEPGYVVFQLKPIA